jgi:hypothetical protein
LLEAFQSPFRQNKPTITPAFHPPLLGFSRTAHSLQGRSSEIRINRFAALLDITGRGFALYRVEIGIAFKAGFSLGLHATRFV